MSSKTAPESFVMMPRSVRRAPVSNTAKIVWAEIASFGSADRPDVPAILHKLATILNCCKHTLSRAIGELLKAGLLKFTGRYLYGKFKIYTVLWYKNIRSARTKMFPDKEQPCSTINYKKDLEFKKNINPQKVKLYQKRLIQKHLEWARQEKADTSKNRESELERARQSVPKQIQQALFAESLAQVAKIVRKKPEQLLMSQFYRDGIDAILDDKLLQRLKITQLNEEPEKAGMGA